MLFFAFRINRKEHKVDAKKTQSWFLITLHYFPKLLAFFLVEKVTAKSSKQAQRKRRVWYQWLPVTLRNS
jgi:hypothetical protein